MALRRQVHEMQTGPWSMANDGQDANADTERVRPRDDPWPGDFQPMYPLPARERVVARVSIWAAFGAITSVVGLLTALTGILSPIGLAVGIMGTLASFIGRRTTRSSHVGGRGLAALGVACGIATIVIAGLAMTRSLSWPNSAIDEVGRWHAWLASRWHWFGRWS
jgi:hypothetical protein